MNGLLVIRWLDGEAERRIGECEREIRGLSVLRERVGAFLESPDAVRLPGLKLPGGVGAEVSPADDAEVSPADDDGYFEEMRELLRALRAAGSHLERLRLLAVAGGGRVNLVEAAEFLVSEGLSGSKDMESLVRNLGSAISGDGARFSRDAESRRTYYLKSGR